MHGRQDKLHWAWVIPQVTASDALAVGVRVSRQQTEFTQLHIK